MTTADAPTIVQLIARLAQKTTERRLQEVAVGRLSELFTTSLAQWGQFLDQNSTAPFGAPQYTTGQREASKALQDTCEINQQREQEQARLDSLRSQEETLRRQLCQARIQYEVNQFKLKYGGDGYL